jgi:hypothetical protein
MWPKISKREGSTTKMEIHLPRDLGGKREGGVAVAEKKKENR